MKVLSVSFLSKLVSLDKNHFNKTLSYACLRDADRKHGYSVKGKPLRSQKLVVRGKHISEIATMTTEGIIGLKIVKGSVTGDHY